MKTPLSMAVILLMVASSMLQAQSYYYSPQGQVPLSVDQGAMAFHFEEGQSPQNLQALEAHPDIADFELHPYHDRIVVEFSNNYEGDLQQLAAELNFNLSQLRSATFSYQTNSGNRLWLTHEVVAQPKSAADLQYLMELSENWDGVYSRDRFGVSVFDVANPEMGLELAAAMVESGRVEWAHTDFYAPIEKHSDPLLGQQFQMDNTGQTIDGYSGLFDIDCNAPEAWAISKGNSSVIVAVVDDGVEDHQDLEDEFGSSRLVTGFSPVTGGNGLPTSSGAHGQACAGIIGASHNNLDVAGLAPEVRLMSINIFVGGETSQDIADGFTFARDNGADVISNSWGYVSSCGLNFSNLTSAINSASTTGRGGLGCVIAFSSGNGYASCVNYPAYLNEVLAVGSITNQGQHSNYSNEGTALDLVAPSDAAPGQPGAGVRTLDRMGFSGYTSGSTTNFFGGTSAACPVVAGTAALIVSEDPAATSAAIRTLMTSTATDMGSPGFDNTFGWGRVNASAALGGAGTPTISVNGNVTDLISGSDLAGVSVRYEGAGGTFNATTDANGDYSISGLIDGELYVIYLGKWGYLEKADAAFASDGALVNSTMEEGYKDQFNTDQGWLISGDATTGIWTRGVPIATDFSGEVANPGNDAGDGGFDAYVTGNAGGTGGTDDVDNGTTILTSLNMDLTGYADPYLNFSYWFYNAGGSGTPDDALVISMDNGSTTAVLATYDANTGAWLNASIRISDFLSITSTMTLIVEASDLPASGHIVEAGFDDFLVDEGTGIAPCTSAPSGTSASVGSTGVTLSWNSLASEGATSYTVSGRRAGSGAYRDLPTPILEPATSAFVNESLLRDGFTYEWIVVAECSGGIFSPSSTPSTFTWIAPRMGFVESQLLPNPSSGFAQLQVQTDIDGNYELRIFDASGKMLKQQSLELSAGSHSIDVSLNNAPEGLYFIQIEGEQLLQRHTLSIQR